MTDQPICLITGASRGLGAALGLAFAKAGYHIIAVARTVGGLEALDDQIKAATGQDATLVPLDLRDSDAIDRMGGALHQRFGKIDVVISNAANMGTLSPIAQSNPKPFEDAWRTNCQAPYRLIRSMDPLLQLSGNGRFIGVTCAAAVDQQPFWGGYGASKAAFDRMVMGYASEVRMARCGSIWLIPVRWRPSCARLPSPVSRRARNRTRQQGQMPSSPLPAPMTPAMASGSSSTDDDQVLRALCA